MALIPQALGLEAKDQGVSESAWIVQIAGTIIFQKKIHSWKTPIMRSVHPLCTMVLKSEKSRSNCLLSSKSFSVQKNSPHNSVIKPSLNNLENISLYWLHFLYELLIINGNDKGFTHNLPFRAKWL